MPYTFDPIEARDPSNPEVVAANAIVTIHAPGDPQKTPLSITHTDGRPMANPVKVNFMGYGPAFMHATLDRVAWSGGEFAGFFTAHDSIKQEAVAARVAAEAAAQAAIDAVNGGGGGGGGGVGTVMYATGNSNVARPTTSNQVMVIFTTTGTTPPVNMLPNLDLWVQRS